MAFSMSRTERNVSRRILVRVIFREPAVDLVEPRGDGRCVVNTVARMLFGGSMTRSLTGNRADMMDFGVLFSTTSSSRRKWRVLLPITSLVAAVCMLLIGH